MKLRRSDERGYFENTWLKSFHSFSFSDYYDPKHMHFRALRVINHDFIAAGSGFPTHPHKDMEIITYVLKGRVAHEDSMGNRAFVTAGEIQVMSAGTGVAHSEFNPEVGQELELLQIWLLPGQKDLVPSYSQKSFAVERQNRLALLASPDARENSLKIHQDVKIYGALMEQGKEVKFTISKGRYAWLQVASGSLEVNGLKISKGDGLSFSEAVDSANASEVTIKSLEARTDFVLFDLN